LVNRKALIGEVDFLLKESADIVKSLTTIQNLKENDARVTFFKHINVVLDSAVISLMVSHKYLGSLSWWEDVHNEYTLSDRLYNHKKQFDYYDQILTNGYFIFMFNAFEHAIRLVCKGYDIKLYQDQHDRLSAMCKGLIKKLGLDNRDKFIDLITYLRNAMHNNGLFIPKGNLKDRTIIWNNTIYAFNENKLIKESKHDLWQTFIPISKEIMRTFNEIINSVPIKSIQY
jgi:hypothetical protein